MGNCFGKPHAPKKTDVKTVELVETTPPPMAKVESPKEALLPQAGVNECHSDPMQEQLDAGNTQTTETPSDHKEEVHERHTGTQKTEVSTIRTSADGANMTDRAEDNVVSGVIVEDKVEEEAGKGVEPGKHQLTSRTDGAPQIYLGYLTKVEDEEDFAESTISEACADLNAMTEERQRKSGESLRRSNSWAVVE